MKTQDKRFPALTDTDLMPFGRHYDEPLQDVPASYLDWLWRDGLNEYSGNGEYQGLQSLNNKRKLANYIWNSKEAIEQDIGETL